MPGIYDARIFGLTLSVAADGLTVTVATGSAYVPDAGRMFVTAPISVVIASPVANTWRHVYIGPASQIQVVATAPAEPYMETARCMTGNNAWRYLGSIRIGADAKALPFLHTQPGAQGNQIEYLVTNQLMNTALLALSLGSLNTPTLIQMGAYLPPTTRRVRAWFENLSTAIAYIGNPDLGEVTATNHRLAIRAGHPGVADLVLCSAAQTLQYRMSAALVLGNGLTMRVIGYTFDR